MRKRFFGFALCTLLLVCFPVEAQQGKIYHVGILMVGSSETHTIKGFRDGLKEIGYIEGKNLVLAISAKETYDGLRPLLRTT